VLVVTKPAIRPVSVVCYSQGLIVLLIPAIT